MNVLDVMKRSIGEVMESAAKLATGTLKDTKGKLEAKQVGMLLANNAMDDLAIIVAKFAAEIAAEIATEPAADTEDIRKQLQDLGISLEAPWDGRKKHSPVEEAQELWEKIQVLARTRS